MGHVVSFLQFKSSLNESQESSSCSECLCPKIWLNNTHGEWEMEGAVRRKLTRTGEDFFRAFSEILGDKEIKDIQVTGDLSNFNHNGSPDLDLYVLVDLSNFEDEDLENIKRKIRSIKFDWDVKKRGGIRGFDIDAHLHDSGSPHSDSGLFSILNNKWIKTPSRSSILDDRDVDKKFSSLAHSIDSIDSKISLKNIPEASKNSIFSTAYRIKRKIQKMREPMMTDSKLKSVASETFKKLKNEGYIDKLVRILSFLPNADN